MPLWARIALRRTAGSGRSLSRVAWVLAACPCMWWRWWPAGMLRIWLDSDSSLGLGSVCCGARASNPLLPGVDLLPGPAAVAHPWVLEQQLLAIS